jgi:predicted ferric reductase
MNQMTFTQPNQRVRLGTKKYLELKRGQDFIEGLAWFSVIAVTAMFLIDGGLQTLSNPAAILGAVDRLTALLATNLLLIDILLIARIPWIDHYYGHDRATAAHKKLGKPILYLVVAHFIASVLQYAIVANVDVITEFISLLSIGDLLLATGAFVLMVLVVVTSLNFARKAVTYEAWYLVHIFAYGAVLLAIPHQFSTGTDIAGKPIAMTYWIAFYLFVLVNVVWYRILRPIVRGVRHSLRVSSVARESSDAVSLYLTGKNVEELGGAAGQFYLVRILTARDWWRPHPFSISAAPNNKYVRFTIADRGDDTKLIQSLKPGTPVLLEGPYGVFTEDRRTREKVVLVAAGIGIPPVRALAEQLAARPNDVTIIYRMRNQDDAALLAETRALAAQRGFRLIELEGRRGIGTSWMNADFSGRSDLDRLKQLVPDVAESDVYICGPNPWTRMVEKTVREAGVESRNIHAEEFAW